MICPKCKTANDEQYVFCVNCGGSLTQGGPHQDIESAVPPTVREVRPVVVNYTPEISQPTVVAPNVRFHRPRPEPQEPLPAQRKGGPWVKMLIAGGVGIILLGILGLGAFALFVWQKTSAEALPDHLGMFSQNAEKSRVDEIKKLDIANAFTGKDSLLKDEGLPVLDPSPTLILYSDGKDVPISDLRLIQLDTIKEDGSFKQIDFQASPIESKPEMKRLKILDGLAGGKYAFALIDGFLNDGKHKFWAFQVRNAAKPENSGSSVHAVTVAIKPTPTPAPSVKPTPTPSAAPPPGTTVAYTTTGNLVLRNGPSQDAAKIRNLRRGEKVYIFRYSQNTEVFDGIESAFAFVQTENGQAGWVFAAFLR